MPLEPSTVFRTGRIQGQPRSPFISKVSTRRNTSCTVTHEHEPFRKSVFYLKY
ncbi:unnamed protein product [Chondrus crispus]|uniref:Uncharacterized protein n=1 Tax=Chondrus crispus TaxID=2769 RepID=R7Q946_CHOCR|nr:unnamed protein product [Chondrus crispus]CDF33916.1 unnamed protein product [Chondrus crispus]|eukprot:XP_005713735.1 unnamed protein product [Chondrus crispus]